MSLIMAAYAPHQPWLQQAIASALGQRGCALELIVVDDGSPRPIAELLDGLADDRLRLLRLDHAGASHARNAGIAASSGAYLRFLDADDVYPPDSTSMLLELAGGSDRVIACGATRWCRHDLRPVLDRTASFRGDHVRACLLLRATPMVPSMLFPRRIVEAAGPWDPGLTVCEDWDFALRALEHAAPVETREPVTWYRQHPASVSRDSHESWRGTLLAVERYFERHPTDRHGPLGRQVASMLDMLAAELARPTAPWRHRRFWRALARDPTSLRTAYARLVAPRAARVRMLAAER